MRQGPIPQDGAGGGVAEDALLSAADRRHARDLEAHLRRWALGPAHAQDVRHLASILGVSERKVRTLVTHLRTAGHPVLATPNRGYFWPSARRDAEHTLAFLQARIETTRQVRAGIRRGLDSEFGCDSEQLALGEAA